jgi:NTP pyrophosphatase (non-canonical NTP hydrolase)
MSTVQQIEHAVEQLRPEDLAAFRSWFAEFDAAQWDRQFVADALAGRLNRLVVEVRQDLREGRYTG